LAVTVVFAVKVTLHVVPVLVVQPLHEENVSVPDVAGAVSITAVPELYIRLNSVVPLELPLLSAGEAEMATPADGFVEATLSV
jgi:hypothetical protein